MRDEDDLWFASLAGRSASAAGTEPEAEAALKHPMTEGAALRAVIRAQNAQPAIDVDEVDPQREAALIARARAAGLLAREALSAPSRRPRRRRWPAWLAAAGLAGIVVGVTFQWGDHPNGLVVRGARSGAVLIRAQDPLGLKHELMRELNDAGVHATGYQSFGREGIDADLPRPLPDAVRNVLLRHGITPPSDSVLQVEIEAAKSP